MSRFWWSDQPGENLFMEITRREDIGTDLRAPLAARGGVGTPGYSLVGAVREGDIVIHYDSRAEAIVGVSRATGDRSNQPFWWAARGSNARKAGVTPAWLPGLAVALEGYRPLAPPLSLSTIRTRRTDIMALRYALATTYSGQPVYYPWIPYKDTIRTFQSYLAKFPRQALAVLPELRGPILELESASEPVGRTQPEIEEAERNIASAAGRPRPARKRHGQGFAVDPRAKVEVESLAMNAALAHYSALGKVTDTSRHESYDYEVEIHGENWHIEVKGTTGSPEEVLLTPNEVRHAAQHPRVSLFVLANVEVKRDHDGAVVASGGEAMVLHPWLLDPSQLTPLAFKYRLPSRSGL